MSTPVKAMYDADGIRLFQADALDLLRFLPDASVNLIATDPPYFRVKGEAWDNAWADADAFLRWMAECVAEMARVLAPGGSLYLFASPQMAGRVEAVVAARLNVLNVITWSKPAFSTKAEMFDKNTMRTFFPASERIVFAENLAFPSVLRRARRNAGLPVKAVAEMFPSATGGATGCVSNWELGLNTPTREQWGKLAEVLDLPPYDGVVRPFFASDSRPYTDVWTFATVPSYAGKHVCEKPLGMMEHIVATSSRPGDVVLDCFMGSGATIEAARNLGRKAIGGDASREWCDWTRDRIAQALLFRSEAA